MKRRPGIWQRGEELANIFALGGFAWFVILVALSFLTSC